jgi:hypothetical protein
LRLTIFTAAKGEIRATDLLTLATKLHALCGVPEARMAQ